MNAVSMHGNSTYCKNVSRNAVSLPHAQSVRFGDAATGVATDATKRGLLTGLELGKAAWGAAAGIILEPVVQPLKANAKKLFWDAEENTVGPLSRQIKKGVNKVRGWFNKVEETEAEKLGKGAKKVVTA